ncbi:MAG: DUF2703 domain-containing protein [Nitrospirota bacterium]|nr:MAG: DUF2703 domain-containing protein [Nitrospirota bacterium]
MESRKTLVVKWQRLLSDGQTCGRCQGTEVEVNKALVALKPALSPLGIDVILKKTELSVAEFQKDTLQSNMIWLNGRLLEEWLEGKTGQSQCGDVCGLHDCRTVGLEEEVYETIPSELIVKAGLLAASQLLASQGTTREPKINS